MLDLLLFFMVGIGLLYLASGPLGIATGERLRTCIGVMLLGAALIAGAVFIESYRQPSLSWSGRMRG